MTVGSDVLALRSYLDDGFGGGLYRLRFVGLRFGRA
jgi:hypothetical protein